MVSTGVAAGGGLSGATPARVTAAIAAVALLAGLSAWMLATRPAGTTAAERAADRALFAAQTGVRPVHIALTGGGGLVDLRYQVVDAEKAAAAHDPKRPPSLIDEASGEPVDQSWMGHSHARAFRTGTSYFELLINPRGRLEHGSEVTLVIGDARLEHLRVE
jgi:hypothetical protein